MNTRNRSYRRNKNELDFKYRCHISILINSKKMDEDEK